MKQRRVIGDVVQIDLGAGRFSFGRVLEEPLVAFYDLESSHIPSPQEIVQLPIVFRIWVMNFAITEGDWGVVGNVALTDDLLEPPRFFKRDSISGKLSITRTGGGDEVAATQKECEGLECAAVWEPEHVVDRLRDHFAGRPNKWVESMKPQ